MRLGDVEDQLMRLYILKDNPKYSTDQQKAIEDCISVIQDTPTPLGFHRVEDEVKYLNERRIW